MLIPLPERIPNEIAALTATLQNLQQHALRLAREQSETAQLIDRTHGALAVLTRLQTEYELKPSAPVDPSTPKE